MCIWVGERVSATYWGTFGSRERPCALDVCEG
jgi:hypothetical protein